jgi:predicted O-linked N-acetylglucosamine transferase (SPINDLY family)
MTADNVDALWLLLAREPANASHWQALARAYAACELPWQATYARRQALRVDSASTEKPPAPAHDPRGDSRLGQDRLDDAAALIERFRARVATSPGDWRTWLYLARLEELAPPREPSASLARAVDCEPWPGETLHWLGHWRLEAGDAPGAIEALSQLLEIRPVRSGSMMILGEALMRTGRVAAAEKAFARASGSTNPAFLLTLATRVFAHNYWQEAIAILRKALSLQGDSVAVLLALAGIQSEVYLLADCRESLRRVQALEPDNAQARLLAAGMLGRFGDARAHLAALQSELAARGDPRSRLASSIAMTSLYHDGLAPSEVAALHRRLCAPIEAAVAARSRASFVVDRTPGRRLRLAFVTADLHRQHPVNLFMQPVLERLDRTRFEVAIYFTGDMQDESTRRARARVDRWVDATALDDAALQRHIVADGVDILVDLAGHTARHRLGVFALRAAPVQASFLGYPHSTGLSTMDWLVGDPIVSPPAHADLYSEGLALLPHCVFCWAPVDDHPLPPPRPADAPVVFGSFNNAMKLSPSTLQLWARVLLAVPASRLLLKAPSLRDETVCASLAQQLGELGIAKERLAFRGPTGLAEMMQEYGDIDIALDPVPYNGGTTTLQALWMGVPVVTLAGGNFCARMGASVLHALGRPDGVAADAESYVAIAARLAADARAARPLRAAERARLAASPLGDITTWVADLEALFERMWQAFLDGDLRRVIHARAANAGSGLKS